MFPYRNAKLIKLNICYRCARPGSTYSVREPGGAEFRRQVRDRRASCLASRLTGAGDARIEPRRARSPVARIYTRVVKYCGRGGWGSEVVLCSQSSRLQRGWEGRRIRIGVRDYSVRFWWGVPVAGSSWGERLLPLSVARAIVPRFGPGVASSPGLLKLLFPPLHFEEPLLDLVVSEPGAIPPQSLGALADLMATTLIRATAHEQARTWRFSGAAPAQGRKLRSLGPRSHRSRGMALSFRRCPAAHHTSDALLGQWGLPAPASKGRADGDLPSGGGLSSPRVVRGV